MLMLQFPRNHKNISTNNHHYHFRNIHSVTFLSVVLSLSVLTQITKAAHPTEPLSSSPTSLTNMVYNIFSNIQLILKQQQSQRYSSTSSTWQGVLTVVAVLVVPCCLFMGVLAVRLQTMASARVEAKNLGLDMHNHNDRDETERQPQNNEKEKEENSNAHLAATSIKEALENHIAPLHLNAMSRLKGVANAQNGRSRMSSRSSSRGSSRSTSPAPELQSHSSSSSLAEELAVPLDMLTDRKGFEELEPLPTHTLICSSKLPALNERLSEETLEDVHAFSDLVAKTTGSSSTRSIQNNVPSSDNSYLETLDEEGDSFDDNEEPSPVIVPTIMEDGTTQVVFELVDSTSTTNTATLKQEQ